MYAAPKAQHLKRNIVLLPYMMGLISSTVGRLRVKIYQTRELSYVIFSILILLQKILKIKVIIFCIKRRTDRGKHYDAYHCIAMTPQS